MIGDFFSQYSPSYPSTLVYMLQSDEYHIIPYLKWCWRISNFNRVSNRSQLDKTPIARLLKATLLIGIVAQLVLATALIVKGLVYGDSYEFLIGILLILSYPILWAHLIAIPTYIGRITYINRRDQKLAHQTKTTFKNHPATVIAVAGSYGKTSLKELLAIVLKEGKKVAATPANKNVITEHAKFARNLSKNEDVLIIEYGEEKPGDILKFAEISQPDYAVITGLAPAHLDKYGSLKAAGDDIFSLADYLGGKNVYVNGDSTAAKDFIKTGFHVYSHKGIGKNSVSDIKIDLDGTKFTFKFEGQSYKLHSGLIGLHHIGPICAAVALGREIGLTKEQIIRGVAKTKPFEHRMEPKIIAGAWVLDDTYNGTIEGMKAGLELLKTLEAKRKIYVTPGLVNQGPEEHRVHQQLGEYIAAANPDITVLMKNSATADIEKGLKNGNYNGIVSIQENPLDYYKNLDKVVAVGDLVMMQNDWPDNYN